MHYLPTLRREIRAKCSQLDAEHIAKVAKQVAANIITLPAFTDSLRMACYMSHQGEVDPTTILHIAHQLGKKIFLPVCRDDQLTFSLYQPGDTLETNQYGILEPSASLPPTVTHELDLALVPLVAFDEACHRVGRGAGYYDKALAFRKNTNNQKPLLIGLAYEFQKVDELSPSAWDVPMDFVVTEASIYAR